MRHVRPIQLGALRGAPVALAIPHDTQGCAYGILSTSRGFQALLLGLFFVGEPTRNSRCSGKKAAVPFFKRTSPTKERYLANRAGTLTCATRAAAASSSKVSFLSIGSLLPPCETGRAPLARLDQCTTKHEQKFVECGARTNRITRAGSRGILTKS